MLSRLKRSTFNLAGRWAACDLRDTIVLAGAPRSGTTWLLELFRTLPGYKALNEPLLVDGRHRPYGFSYRTCIAPGEERPQERTYLRKLLQGQFDLPQTWLFEARTQPMQLLEHFNRRKLVVKFCRVGRMLQWLCCQFEMRGTVLLIRHPCAVVASMIQHGAWDEIEVEGWLQRSLKHEVIPEVVRREFGSTLRSIDTRAKMLSMRWCLDYYIPFHLHREAGYPWVLTAYEHLVTEGVAELERVAAALDVEVTQAMRAQFDTPSSSVRDRPRQEAQAQLSKWQERLTPGQVDDVLRIVEDFELDFYTDNLHPDYDRLMQFQRTDVIPAIHAT